MFLQGSLQFGGIHISLEGHFELGVLGLVNGAVECRGVATLDVSLGGVEVGVAGHHVTLFHEIGEEHVLGGSSLVGGDDVFEAREPGDGLLHLQEGACAGIALVAHHDARPLAVAHGSGA